VGIGQPKMINVALIGKGYWGSKLEKYIQENQDVCLEIVCNSKSDLFNEVYGKPSIDAVIVATPNQTHYQITRAAILNGKHVMVEKPLALRTEECHDLEELAEKKGVALCTDYTHTFSKSLQLAQKTVANREIGDICGIEMHMRQFGRFGRGSVYWLLASHMLAVLDMFVPLDGLEFYKNDTAIHQGNVEAGTIYFNNDSLHGDISVSLNCPNKERSVVIYGERGRITYNPLLSKPLHIVTYERAPRTANIQLPLNERFFEFDESNNLSYAINYFYEVIHGKLKSNAKTAILVTQVLEGLK